LTYEPIAFLPVFRSYLWGGRRLQSVFGKLLPDEGIWAESWEVIDHGKEVSVIAEGTFQGLTLRELIQRHPEEILGPGNSADTTLPLLLKFLDCNQVLSIQVHPNDVYASQMPTADLGKTEAWYVIDALPGSKIYAGLKHGINQEELRSAIFNGNVSQCMHAFEPVAGDCVFIPAGTVHALGEGLLVAEIQQASDTTFRLFDWNRLGPDGNPRPLHIDQALEVTDFSRGPVNPVQRQASSYASLVLLVDCDRFRLYEIDPQTSGTITPFPLNESFAIVTCMRGSIDIQWGGDFTSQTPKSRTLQAGETLLAPAVIKNIALHPSPGSRGLLAQPPSIRA
jgi:mannose-6-phosphate isomerase